VYKFMPNKRSLVGCRCELTHTLASFMTGATHFG
jgi:hypothetical protein